MYTVPKPSNGAPTAMSGEERQKGVTTMDHWGLWAPSPQTLCSSHKAQHTLDLTMPGSTHTIREQSSMAQIKTGTIGHPNASFYMWESRSRRGK